jgi:hypothetical protein
MALLYDPSITFNAQGNILATSTSIAALATNSAAVVDFSTNSLGGWVQIAPTGGGTVNATNGCLVSIYPAGDSAPHYDTVAIASFTIPITASTQTPQSILLPTGKYSITLKNLDAGSNAITCGVTSNPMA